MVAIRIEFDDKQYERLKELKKHRGLTWKGLLLEGEKKVREDTPSYIIFSTSFETAVNSFTPIITDMNSDTLNDFSVRHVNGLAKTTRFSRTDTSKNSPSVLL
jgi:hypothetical protein